jgi:hypothetical protein
VRCCVSRALTLLAATSALAGCGGEDKPSAPPVPRDLQARDGRTGATTRAEVLAAAERAITADARSRRELKDRTRRTDCKPRQGEDAHAETVVYDCLAVTFEIKGTVNAPPLASGYPFQVRVEYPKRRFTWCKVRPPGGEGTGRPGREIAPPDACGGTGK